MFVVEGVVTLLLGAAIPLLVSDSVDEAPWLSAEEKAWVMAAQQQKEGGGGGGGETETAAAAKATATATTTTMTPEAGATTTAEAAEAAEAKEKQGHQQQRQSILAAAAEALQVAKSPQMWTLGVAILLVQTAFFAVTFFAPLLIAETFSRESLALSAAADAKGGKVIASSPPPYLGPKAAADAAMHAAFKSTAVYAPR